jgi:hypothetical protein
MQEMGRDMERMADRKPARLPSQIAATALTYIEVRLDELYPKQEGTP